MNFIVRLPFRVVVWVYREPVHVHEWSQWYTVREELDGAFGITHHDTNERMCKGCLLRQRRGMVG